MAGSGTKWVTLGDVIEQTNEQNSAFRFGLEDVRGMTLTKEVIPTKANLSGNDLSKFLIVYPNEFIYNPRTHGKRIGLGYNNTGKPFLISWNNVAFKVKDAIIPEYLYMYFCRLEWDREACYRSWGSSTEVFSWDALCSMKFPLPSIKKQKDIVAEWKGLRAMKEQNEQIAQPLMELCQSYIEECKKKYPVSFLGDFIEAIKQHCGDSNAIVSGVDINKEFIETRANLEGTDVKKYYQVLPNQFAANLMHIGRDERIPIAFNNTDKTLVVTSAYYIFQVKEKCKNVILSDYLSLYFHNPEIDRICWFFTDSSVRGNLQENRLFDIPIPLPPIEVQQAIVNIYKSAQEAKKIAEEADKLSNEICPALIQHVIHS